jgi:hypothetical protein
MRVILFVRHRVASIAVAGRFVRAVGCHSRRRLCVLKQDTAEPCPYAIAVGTCLRHVLPADLYAAGWCSHAKRFPRPPDRTRRPPSARQGAVSLQHCCRDMPPACPAGRFVCRRMLFARQNVSASPRQDTAEPCPYSIVVGTCLRHVRPVDSYAAEWCSHAKTFLRPQTGHGGAVSLHNCGGSLQQP